MLAKKSPQYSLLLYISHISFGQSQETAPSITTLNVTSSGTVSLAINKAAILTLKTAGSLILELKVKLNGFSNFYSCKFATTLVLQNPVLFAVC